MNYFNGFSLCGESELFKDILIDNPYTIIGFSYGAILAMEELKKRRDRVDRLILISPAFFNNVGEKFISLQLKAWDRDRDSYLKKFLKSVAYPSNISLDNYLKAGSKNDLEKLLKYRWSRDELLSFKESGVTIEVFIGEKDKIVNSKESLEFFKSCSLCYFIKGVGHILK